jgi:hypothetical protein
LDKSECGKDPIVVFREVILFTKEQVKLLSKSIEWLEKCVANEADENTKPLLKVITAQDKASAAKEREITFLGESYYKRRFRMPRLMNLRKSALKSGW